MTREEFRDRALQTLILDGATGSNLRSMGMPIGVCTEAWILDNPEPLQALQGAYADAGSDVVYAPTFCANRIGLARYGLEGKLIDMNRRLIALSRAAVGTRALVAADLTTTGLRVDEAGGIGYAELIEVYAEQASAQYAEGVDLFAVETMLGVTECSAAIEGIRSVCDLPILCTLTLDAVGAAYFDGDAEQAAHTLPQLGVDAIGVNCGGGPELAESVVKNMRALTDLPIIAKPNAGMPEILPDGTAHYAMTPTRFARGMHKLQKLGASLLGGCCGTTPEHIRALAEMCRA